MSLRKPSDWYGMTYEQQRAWERQAREQEDLEYERDRERESREQADASARRERDNRRREAAAHQEEREEWADELSQVEAELALRNEFLKANGLSEEFDWVLKDLGYDPEADIAAMIEGALDTFAGVVELGKLYEPPPMLDLWSFSGEPAAKPARGSGLNDLDPSKLGDGLGVRLKRLSEQREAVRTAALKNLILEGGDR